MSNEKPSNPHVHPTPVDFRDGGTTVTKMQPGMTLRDWFAGQFFAAQVAAPQSNGLTTMDIARVSYKWADAMLKVREEQ